MLRGQDGFRQDEDGAILVFFAIALALILAVVAVSFDLGMKASTQAELQAYADHVALAAAGELDGKTDSITRATAAAANMVVDRQSFATGAKTLSGAADYALTFFSALPGSDTAAMTGTTTDGKRAAYVRVVVTPRSVPFSIWPAVDAVMGTSTSAGTTSAQAVAGYTQYACDVTPLMFCLPNSTFRAKDNVGVMIDLRSGGNGAAWGPGDFGFLDPAHVLVDPNGPCAGLSGGNLDRCLVAAEGSITQCFVQKGVNTEPGQKNGIENAVFNVRFDIYNSTMNSKRTDANYPPAPNVIKGIVPNGGGSCIGNNSKVSPNTAGLPRDTCFAAGTCGRVGNGNWSAGRTTYVQKNYGGTDPFPAATTRYQYYLAELAAHGGAAGTAALLPAGRAETGRPVCSPNKSTDPDRRVVIAAGIDCTANPISGATANVPVAEFVKLFLTEPVGQDGSSPPKVDIWVEVVGPAESGSGTGLNDGVFHDVVQLYR